MKIRILNYRQSVIISFSSTSNVYFHSVLNSVAVSVLRYRPFHIHFCAFVYNITVASPLLIQNSCRVAVWLCNIGMCWLPTLYSHYSFHLIWRCCMNYFAIFRNHFLSIRVWIFAVVNVCSFSIRLIFIVNLMVMVYFWKGKQRLVLNGNRN